ncbi:SGNH/GDSL hydrolase family protein [Aquibacillus koreensis]|uniref:SGNH/GDSL hydrolase family protein n=1 Tax=Aquibacillus koreensis TaxID=279446 RepID=A0A9X4AJW2_9BACI|nr:SGNH/GDSL hydrolase family protein [Aquibacillus koreensis]MCT2538221.1 SGNH/GDSL hydrolase family protein [Aquibacillus koreensis]MDC3420835.1 SGNH/GDSL hydrolase family protein [Aquibacillus koreensis]
MNGKKTFLITSGILLFILVLAIIFIKYPTSSPDHDGATMEESEQTDDQDIEEVTEEIEEELQEEVNESHHITDEIKKSFIEIIDETIDFFVKTELDIVAIGDSLTEGVGDTTDNGGYVGILNDKLHVYNSKTTLTNYGKRGNRSDQLLKRLEDEEISQSMKEADIVLITIGANDIMKVLQDNFMNLREEPFREARKDYVIRLRTIFDTILEQNPDAHIFLIGFYNPFEQYFSDIKELEVILDNWNRSGEEVTKEFKEVDYIPMKDLFEQADENLLAEDNFHPNPNGYEVMAARIYNHLHLYIEQTEAQLDQSDAEVEAGAEQLDPASEPLQNE